MALAEKWKPITKWIPQIQAQQAIVLAETGYWVPLDRALSHIAIETGWTGDPKILSRGTNAPCPNPGNECAADLRAHGLFQIYWPPFQVQWNKIHDPDYNIYCGLKTLAYRRKQCGSWDGASMAFFSGSCVDVGVIDNSTGTDQKEYLDAMQRNMADLNANGIGTGDANSDPKSPPVGNGNTPTGEPSSPPSSENCLTVLGKEICAPSTGDVIGAVITANFGTWMQTGIVLVIGVLILFIGLRAIT